MNEFPPISSEPADSGEIEIVDRTPPVSRVNATRASVRPNRNAFHRVHVDAGYRPRVNPVGPSGYQMGNYDIMGRGLLDENGPLMLINDLGRDDRLGFNRAITEFFGGEPMPQRPRFEREPGYDPIRDPRVLLREDADSIIPLIEDSRSSAETQFILNRWQNPYRPDSAIESSGWYAFGRLSGGFFDVSAFVPFAWAKGAVRGSLLMGGLLGAEDLAKQAIDPDRDDMDFVMSAMAGAAFGGFFGRLNYTRSLPASINRMEASVDDVGKSGQQLLYERIQAMNRDDSWRNFEPSLPDPVRANLVDDTYGAQHWRSRQRDIFQRLWQENSELFEHLSPKGIWEIVRRVDLSIARANKQSATMMHMAREAIAKEFGEAGEEGIERAWNSWRTRMREVFMDESLTFEQRMNKLFNEELTPKTMRDNADNMMKAFEDIEKGYESRWNNSHRGEMLKHYADSSDFNKPWHEIDPKLQEHLRSFMDRIDADIEIVIDGKSYHPNDLIEWTLPNGTRRTLTARTAKSIQDNFTRFQNGERWGSERSIIDDLYNGAAKEGLKEEWDAYLEATTKGERAERLRRIEEIVLDQVAKNQIEWRLWLAKTKKDLGLDLTYREALEQQFVGAKVKGDVTRGTLDQLDLDPELIMKTNEQYGKIPRRFPSDPVPSQFRGKTLRGAQAIKAFGLERLGDNPVKRILQNSESAYAKELIEEMTEISFLQNKNLEVGGYTKTDNAAQLILEAEGRANILMAEIRSDYHAYLQSLGIYNPGMMRRAAGRSFVTKKIFDDTTHSVSDAIPNSIARMKGIKVKGFREFSEDITRYRAYRGRLERRVERGEASKMELDRWTHLAKQENQHIVRAAEKVDDFFVSWVDDLHSSGMLYQSRTRLFRKQFAEHADMEFFEGLMTGHTAGFKDRRGVWRGQPKGWKPTDGPWATKEQIRNAMKDRMSARGSMSDEAIEEAIDRLEELWEDHLNFLKENTRATPRDMDLSSGAGAQWLEDWKSFTSRWQNVPELEGFARALADRDVTHFDFDMMDTLLNSWNQSGIWKQSPDAKRFYGEFTDLMERRFGYTEDIRQGTARSEFEKHKSNMLTSAVNGWRTVDRMMDDYAAGITHQGARNHFFRVWRKDKITENKSAFAELLRTRAKVEDDVTGNWREPTNEEINVFINNAEQRGDMGRLRNEDDGWSLDPRKWFEPEAAHGSTGTPTTLARRKWQLDEADFEDYLNFETVAMTTVYGRNTAPDVVLSNLFGRADMQDQIALVRKEYNDLINAGGDPETLLKQFERDREDILAVRDQLRGTYGLPKNPNSWTSRTLRSFKHYNMLTQLTGMIAAVPDIGLAMLQHGMVKGFQSSFALLGDIDVAALSKRNLNVVNEATDLFTSQRHSKLMNLDEFLGIPTGAEGFWAKMSDVNFRWVNMMDQWNSRIKVWANMMYETRANEILNKYFNGEVLSKRERIFVERNFDTLDDNLMAQLEAMIADSSKESTTGVKVIDGARASERYPQAYRAYTRAGAREVRTAIVTPTPGDSPNFILGEYGSVIFQYWRFVASATNRVAMLSLQYRDAQVLMGITAAVGLGVIVEQIRRSQLGMDPLTDPREMVLAGIERSGVLGYLTQANNVLERLSDNRMGLSALFGVAPPYGTSWRTKVGAVGGPTASQIANFIDVGIDIGTDRISHNRARAATARQIGNMFPAGNVATFAKFSDKIDDMAYSGLTALTQYRSRGRERNERLHVPREEAPISPADEFRVE